MRNALRVLAFDIAAPLVTIAALVLIGAGLGWPLWWVSACSVLCLLIVEGIAVNYFLMRRDSVTVGTDDDGPGLRLAVVGLATATLVATVVVAYTLWTVPDRALKSDSAEVVRIASSVSEATATFAPQNPSASVDRAAALMAPDRAAAFKAQFAKTAEDLAKKNISAQANTISAGVEAIGPNAASVAVILRGTQNVPGAPPSNAVLALRVTLANDGGQWLVIDVTPINAG